MSNRKIHFGKISAGVTAPVLLPIVASSRDSFAITYIAGAAEASRDEGSNDHERDNDFDRSGYVSHLALILSFLLKILRKLFYEKPIKELG
jgi:hypothetical protein